MVAEADGRIVGSNCMDERGAVAGDRADHGGPGRAEPRCWAKADGRGVGAARGAQFRQCAIGAGGVPQPVAFALHHAGVRREGAPVGDAGPCHRESGSKASAFAPAQSADLDGCNRVCHQVHGHDRGGEAADAIAHGTARVVERHGRITGYASALAFFGHAVAESNPDLQALIAAAEGFEGPGILVPTRNSALFRWCLANGLRVVEPMTLMAIGLYKEPAGAFLPSITY